MCELKRDLEVLPAGDQTEIGENGINLSGGQKARIALARAIYADKEIIMMDDPISSLDANVKGDIFDQVLMGYLKHKTRILVTHSTDCLHLVDQIILFKSGQIVAHGPYNSIKDHPYLKNLDLNTNKASPKPAIEQEPGEDDLSEEEL